MAGKIEKNSAESDKHTSDATCLLFHADHVFSGGADGKIKVLKEYFKIIIPFQSDVSAVCILIHISADLECRPATKQRNRCP